VIVSYDRKGQVLRTLIELTSRTYDGNNLVNNLDPVVDRRITRMALQYPLGLLPNGRVRSDTCDRPDPCLARQDLAVYRSCRHENGGESCPIG
jgi:hypothetical protein